MTLNLLVCCHFLQLKKKTKDDDEIGSQVIVVVCIWKIKSKDNDEPLDLLSSSTIEKKMQKMITNQEVHYLSSVAKEKTTKDDDELGSQLVIVFYNLEKKH